MIPLALTLLGSLSDVEELEANAAKAEAILTACQMEIPSCRTHARRDVLARALLTRATYKRVFEGQTGDTDVASAMLLDPSLVLAWLDGEPWADAEPEEWTVRLVFGASPPTPDGHGLELSVFGGAYIPGPESSGGMASFEGWWHSRSRWSAGLVLEGQALTVPLNLDNTGMVTFSGAGQTWLEGGGRARFGYQVLAEASSEFTLSAGVEYGHAVFERQSSFVLGSLGGISGTSPAHRLGPELAVHGHVRLRPRIRFGGGLAVSVQKVWHEGSVISVIGGIDGIVSELHTASPLGTDETWQLWTRADLRAYVRMHKQADFMVGLHGAHVLRPADEAMPLRVGPVIGFAYAPRSEPRKRTTYR